MGGDLNLKKSWHPVLMSNQRRVWEEEKKALDERKRTEQRVKELKEERAREEIERKLEAAGGRKRVDRVDWMYQGPSSGQAGTAEELEGYLLGKRRIDGLIKGDDHKKLEKQSGEQSFMAMQNANTMRDTALKVREDPLLAIKKQEQAAYEAMMNDPIKRKQLLAAIGVEDKQKRHRRDSDDERHRRRRDRRREDRHSDRGRERRDDYRDRSRHRRRSRSSSPASRSPDRSRDRRRERERKYERRSPSTSRSASPPRRDQRRDRRDGRDYRREDRRQEERRAAGSRTTRDGAAPGADREAERQRRLAEMQQDATTLDHDRERRLAAITEREQAARDADDAARAKKAKYGDTADFVMGLHRKAGDMDLADRLGRGRQGLQRQED